MILQKICYVTANRSDYAKVKYLLNIFSSMKDVELRIVATGSMLNERYGYPYRDIEKDGFCVNYRVNCLFDDDSPSGILKSMAMQLYEMSLIFEDFKPDIVILVGDRYDILPAATACLMHNIPIAHIQGGEKTGTIDDTIRDVITKMSHLHFVATKEAKERVIKIGENENKVFDVGCPSIDYIMSLDIPDDIDLTNLMPYCKNKISLSKKDKYFIIMIHPNVTDKDDINFDNILSSLDEFQNPKIVFYPNNDPLNYSIVSKINRRNDIIKFKHIPMSVFMMLLKNCACLIGNSSCGIRESCYFGVPTINIGKRQNGREHGKNVIDLSCDKRLITEAIKKQLVSSYEPEFIYGDGNSSKRILNILTGITSINYKNVRM